MDFSIYSVGDAAFLEQIMIAVAMATGTGDFERMVSIGLLIGALIISFQSLFRELNPGIYIKFLLVGSCMPFPLEPALR